jgi:hypothetical protein
VEVSSIFFLELIILLDLEGKKLMLIVNINAEQPTMTDSWKCEFCHSSEISEVRQWGNIDCCIHCQYLTCHATDFSVLL